MHIQELLNQLPSDGSVAGIDIGGTKTHLRIQSGEGSKDFVLPSSDWRRRDWKQDAHALLLLLREMPAKKRLLAVAVGAHGCDNAEECREFEAAFKAVTELPVTVVNDSELLPAAFGLHNQIGVVAGTGSIAVCRTKTDEMLVAGGWGWVLGDEGSAPSLVRAAAVQIACHLDSGGTLSDDPLIESFFTGLSIPSAARIGTRIEELGSAREAGRYAHIIFEAADDGSKLASTVIEEGGRALAGLVSRLQQRGANAHTAVAGGGVITAQPRLWEAFRASILAAFGQEMSVHLHRGAPVEGAIVLAAQLLTQHR